MGKPMFLAYYVLYLFFLCFLHVMFVKHVLYALDSSAVLFCYYISLSTP